ncbi:MAG: hypothetical protein GX036_11060 [Firmicutes bacterium]|nr:hypothetical protein [Bacillota bacterium]
MEDRANLEKKHENGSGWFRTIAVLSLINMVIVFAEWNVMFPVGLGTALYGASLYAYAPEHPYENAVRFVALFFLLLSLVIIGLLFFFGKKAKEGKSWAYITGMIIYFGDALLCAWLEDWISVGFHAWGLFSIWSGFSALKALKNLESQETPETLELQG